MRGNVIGMELDNREYLNEQMQGLGIELTEIQINQFIRYYEMLIEWNKMVNLTAITDYKEVAIKHFVDSVSLVKIEELDEEKRILDIGTGAGFPAIPLKIVFPNLKITMIDSLNKRIKFLDAVIEELELDDIEALHGRAEDFAKDSEHREQYDIVVSRAVANLATLCEYCLPYVKIGGRFVSYKSEKISEESKEASKAIKLLGGKFERQVDYMLPDSEFYRNLYVIKKIEATNKKYPRKAGLPAKEPLK